MQSVAKYIFIDSALQVWNHLASLSLAVWMNRNNMSYFAVYFSAALPNGLKTATCYSSYWKIGCDLSEPDQCAGGYYILYYWDQAAGSGAMEAGITGSLDKWQFCLIILISEHFCHLRPLWSFSDLSFCQRVVAWTVTSNILIIWPWWTLLLSLINHTQALSLSCRH